MRGAVLAVVAVACLAIPGVSSAAKVGGEVFGAFNTHGMSDVNDALEASNLGAGTNFDDIKSGLTGGLAVRVWPTGTWMLSAGWEPLFLESTDDATSTTLNVDAQSFQATLAYFIPSMTPAKFGFGGGLGMYNIAGEQSSGGLSVDIEGSGVGFHLMGVTEMTVSPGFAVTGGLGWRWADIEIDDAAGQTADYSGVMARVGLSFYLPTPTP
jgi:hypothetical protein